MFLSKKGKALKGNYWENQENIQNMTKILFEEVSDLNRRFKVLEQQVKIIIQELYGFRRIFPEDENDRINLQQPSPKVKDRIEDSQISAIGRSPYDTLEPSPSTSSKDLFPSPSLPASKKELIPRQPSFTSTSEPAHPPNPTFPSPSQSQDEEPKQKMGIFKLSKEEPEQKTEMEQTSEKSQKQKDEIYHIIPRVKLATKKSTN